MNRFRVLSVCAHVVVTLLSIASSSAAIAQNPCHERGCGADMEDRHPCWDTSATCIATPVDWTWTTGPATPAGPPLSLTCDACRTRTDQSIPVSLVQEMGYRFCVPIAIGAKLRASGDVCVVGLEGEVGFQAAREWCIDTRTSVIVQALCRCAAGSRVRCLIFTDLIPITITALTDYSVHACYTWNPECQDPPVGSLAFEQTVFCGRDTNVRTSTGRRMSLTAFDVACPPTQTTNGTSLAWD